MTPLDVRPLVDKLNDTCRRALEAAAGLTLSRTHYNVEVEHWLLKLLDVEGTDLGACLKHYELDPGRLAAGINQVLERLKTGNTRAPALAPQIVSLIREAWLVASVVYQAPQIRSGHLLLALLSDDAPASREAAALLGKIGGERLRAELPGITAATAETGSVGAAGAAKPGVAGPGAAAGGALDRYTIDLTALAKAGKVDPVLGRDAEIRQVIDILTRRRQNNPILTGEAGVGKTAVVEGFALKIVAGDVPPALQNVVLRTLDLGLLQAGAGVKGEFESRLKQVIEEVVGSPRPIILFIDEAHTLIGAGGQAGQGDAANLLKPALARGELRTVAATTWAEYKKYFERDAALTRRFQVVRVDEPSDAAATDMLRGLVRVLEGHHGVRILDEAVAEAVRLSRRYIPARQLPDKAVSILDTACARVAISQSAVPAAIEDRRRRIELLETERAILAREAASGSAHGEALAALGRRKAEVADELGALEARWEKEKALAGELRRLRQQLEDAHERAAREPAPAGRDSDAAEWRAQFDRKGRQLRELQGESPLLQVAVTQQAVAEVVANWTGIPVGRMVANEIKTVLNLEAAMGARIIGQKHALQAIAVAMQTSRARLTDPRKPIGVFLMVGTSGVGKTETALTLAELLYGGEQNLTVINMSEFKEEHKVSMLVGSPPGYVGYGEGGVLTEAVRRRPYSVVLLDEMEKAHPGVQDVFYQVFDKGQLRDGEGRDIDFKNTVIIMTSNAGTDAIAKLCADPDTMPDPAGLAEALRPDLLKIFKPAFLGRVTVVPYLPLSDEVLRQIVKLQLDRIRRRVEENYKATCSYDPALVEHVAARCKEVESGARNIESILARGLLAGLSAQMLARMAEGQTVERVRLGVSDEGEFTYDLGLAVA